MKSIISWNVNGLRSVHKKGLFLPFIDKYKPDILLLQETKAMRHQSELDLREYEEYWNSASKKGYSGTAIFTKVKPLSVINGIPEHISNKYGLKYDDYGDVNSEGRVVSIELKDVFVVCVYTPNTKDNLGRLTLRHKHWDPAFLAYMKYLEAKKPVIFGGDLNVAHKEIDLANPKSNEGKKGFTKEEREGIDNMIEKGFIDTFRMFNENDKKYTWWSHFANSRARNVGWRIDYIFASEKLKNRIINAEILNDVMGSDHCPVKIVFK